MADNEYIKRSEVVALIEDELRRCEIVLEALDLASLRTKVMGLRSADVAPKADVDRLRFNLKAVLDERAVDKAEVAMEIFEELRRYIINHCYLADDDVDAIWKHIDKLEKKYTEDKK